MGARWNGAAYRGARLALVAPVDGLEAQDPEGEEQVEVLKPHKHNIKNSWFLSYVRKKRLHGMLKSYFTYY